MGIGPGIAEEDLDELAALSDSAGAEPVARVVQSRAEPDPATFIGKGRLDDLHATVHANGADIAIFDHELTPGQLRSLEERLGVKVIDRTALILDIFALHARSREGKAQVELAQLSYLLPRLRGWGEAMSRLGGGIGTRGPGETKMEVDRQHIRRRVVEAPSGHRDPGAHAGHEACAPPGQRDATGVDRGYTNAGKSTLMNRLTGADVLVADQLFATLDPTVRRLKLPGRAPLHAGRHGGVRRASCRTIWWRRSDPRWRKCRSPSSIVHVADASSRRTWARRSTPCAGCWGRSARAKCRRSWC